MRLGNIFKDKRGGTSNEETAQKLLPNLQESYPGDYVAIHGGKVIMYGTDQDDFLTKLEERGLKGPVLWGQITKDGLRQK